MPNMPDPISTCPILDRLFDRSHKKGFLQVLGFALDTSKTLVEIGTDSAIDVINDQDKEWECPGGATYTEAEWLTRFWFDSATYWWGKTPGRSGFDQKIRDTLKAAIVESLKQGKHVPIKTYWICVGDILDCVWSGVEKNGSKPKNPKYSEIRVSILTPPPEEECERIVS